jgi:hypothetical protein
MIGDKAWSRTWITQSGTVSLVPCRIAMISVLPKFNKRTNAILYDDPSAPSNPIIDVGCAVGVSNNLYFDPAILCESGLYVVLDTDILGCFIMYKPV